MAGLRWFSGWMCSRVLRSADSFFAIGNASYCPTVAGSSADLRQRLREQKTSEILLAAALEAAG